MASTLPEQGRNVASTAKACKLMALGTGQERMCGVVVGPHHCSHDVLDEPVLPPEQLQRCPQRRILVSEARHIQQRHLNLCIGARKVLL